MRSYLLCCLFPLAGFAQTDTIRLSEITVSASKFEQPGRQTPFQVQGITREQIAFRSQQNTADMLAQTGAVFVQKSQGGGGSPVLRGFEASRVLLMVDGIRLNNAISRAGHQQNALRIDPAVLERVEVLFGAGSTLYGSDALGGVVYFQTRTPELSATNQPQVRPSAYVRYATATGERTAHADVSIGTRRWGFLSSITAAAFGDVVQGVNRRAAYPDFGKLPRYVRRDAVAGTDRVINNPNSNRQVGSAYGQLDLLQKVLFQPREGVQHLLNLQLSTTTDVPRYDRLTEQTGGKPRFAEWYYGPEKRQLAAYRFTLSRPTVFSDKLLVSAAYQHLAESRHTRRLLDTLLKRQRERVNVWSLNADVQKRLGGHRLQYGLELTRNEVTSTATYLNVTDRTTTPADTRYPAGGSQLQTAAAYLTDEWTLSPLALLTAGARYSVSDLRASFGEKLFFPFPFTDVRQSPAGLSGHLGLVFTLTSRTKISAVGSAGFRAPNVDDLTKVFDSRPGVLVVPNPAIRPERTYSAELSGSQWLGDRIKLDATVYYTWFTDAIVVDAFTLNGAKTVTYAGQVSTVLAAQNKRRAVLSGFSLSTQVRLARRLTFMGTLNGTSGRILDGNDTPLDHIPPVFGRASLRYLTKKMELEAFSLFNGWKRIADYNPDGEDNPQYATPDGMPAWATANVRGSIRLGRVLTVQLAAENLFDLNYRTFASGISAPGRNVMVTLRAGL